MADLRMHEPLRRLGEPLDAFHARRVAKERAHRRRMRVRLIAEVLAVVAAAALAGVGVGLVVTWIS